MAHTFLCTAPGCDKPVPEKNEATAYFCNDHLRRWKQYGDPLGGAPRTSSGEQLAWIKAHVSYSGIGCLIWPFSRHQQGYPNQVSDGDDRKRATRIMCELAHGPAPTPEHQAAHACHNGHLGCIHPQHLHWLTNAENAAESAAMRRDAIVRGVPAKKTSSRSTRTTKVLTVKGIEKAELREKRYEIPDASLPSFYLSVMPSGHKSFCVRYRFHGTPRRLGLGSHPQITLQAARQAARNALARVAMGNDPAAEKKTLRRTPVASSAPQTVDDLIDKFLAHHVRMKCRANTAASYESMLKKCVLPAWEGRPLEAIKRADVRALIEEIAEGEDPRPILSNRILAVLSSMFAWGVEKEFLAASPAIGVKKAASENKRQRALSDAELRLVLNAADKLPRTGRDFTRLLALTMQRRNEVAHMRWEEVDLDARVWVIPSERAKNHREHRIPLSTPALRILRDRKKDETGSPYVFCRGRNPFNGFARLKEALDKAIAEANGGPIPHWTLHDLRRSGASVMPRLGVSLPVTERILNHVSGSFAGIVATYQTYNYEGEMRSAMEEWANHLAGIQVNNVIPLRSIVSKKYQ